MPPSARWFAIAFVVALAVAGPCQAGLMFQLESSGSPGPITLSGVGQTADVRVYLAETGGTILADEQLFSAGVRLTFGGPAVGVVSLADVTADPAFDDVVKGLSASDASLNVAALVNPFVSPDANNRILLGTFRFTALQPGAATITATDLNPTVGSIETVTGFGTPLDGDVANGQLLVTVQGSVASPVPEPAGIVVFGVGLVLAAAARGRAWARTRKTR